MHILVLTSNYPNPYFPERTCFFRDYVRIPAARGHQVGLVGLIAVSVKDIVGQRRVDFGPRQTDDAISSSCIYLYPTPPKWRSMDRLLRNLLTRRMIRHYVKRCGLPDVIHAHGLPAGEEARWWHRLTGVPYVFTAHSPIFYGASVPKTHLRTLGRVARDAAVCTAVSRGFADLLTDLSKRSFSFLPNPVDTDFFRPAEHRQASADRPYTFVNVAALKENKNHAGLIRAFARAFGGASGYRLLIGGEGAERCRLDRLIDELGLTGRVRLLGHLDRDQVVNLLQVADCFVLSSINETFGVVLIEAMACGLPVIATRSHGPDEIITSKKLGVLVENGVGALSSAMRDMSEQTDRDGMFRREHVIAEYSFDVIGRKCERIYEHVTSGSGP